MNFGFYNGTAAKVPRDLHMDAQSMIIYISRLYNFVHLIWVHMPYTLHVEGE